MQWILKYDMSNESIHEHYIDIIDENDNLIYRHERNREIIFTFNHKIEQLERVVNAHNKTLSK